MSAQKKNLQVWEAWYPKAAATGLLIGRGKIDPAQSILLHAAPDFISVTVTDEQGKRIAQAEDLEKTLDSPICRLTLEGEKIVRTDIWPADSDIGSLVLLPGGEVGVLQSWWNTEDKKEWRWQVEFYNSTR